MAFLSEPEPPYGQATRLLPGVRRLVANNPSAMTYHGTNTYLIDGVRGTVVLDPGPDDSTHVAAIVDASLGKVEAILLSHHHRDHVGAAQALREATGAPIYAHSAAAEHGVAVDETLDEGDVVAGLCALHTPGHAPDHLAFARSDGLLFTGDHVMAWSTTSVLSPGGGNLSDYKASLKRLLARSDSIHLAGHGPPLPNPRGHVEDLLREREQREWVVRRALDAGAITLDDVLNSLYPKLTADVRSIAELSIRPYLAYLALAA